MLHLDREPAPAADRYKAARGFGVVDSTAIAGSSVFLDQEAKPVIIDVEEFRYAYKCKHCGHEWSEKHLEEHREH
jgi:hypothetical protein